MNIEDKKPKVLEKLTKAGFLVRFTKSVLEQFEEKTATPDKDIIIPEFLFKQPRE